MKFTSALLAIPAMLLGQVAAQGPVSGAGDLAEFASTGYCDNDPVKYYTLVEGPLEDGRIRERNSNTPDGAGGIGGEQFDVSPVENLLKKGCDPHMALQSCPGGGKFKMYYGRTWSTDRNKWSKNPGDAKCLDKDNAPEGFTGSIQDKQGSKNLAKMYIEGGSTLNDQSWIFKWGSRHCFVIESALHDTSGNCMTNNTAGNWCESINYNSPDKNIERAELIWGCCDLNGDGNVTKDVGELLYSDERTQDGGAKTKKWTDKTGDLTSTKRAACETYKSANISACEGPFCQATMSCTLRRGLRQLRFDSWPNVSVADREDVHIEVKILDTDEIITFKHNDGFGFPGTRIGLDDSEPTPDNFFVRPSFYLENEAIFTKIYNAQYRDGFAMQFVSEENGPGGWNPCHYSPIGIDIKRNGFVGVIEGTFHINIDGDDATGMGADTGDEILNEWFAPDVGILVHDAPEDDGTVSGKHLMGDMGGKYADGFEKLATFDLNEDGIVDEAELTIGNFKLWIDADSDAHMDQNEIHEMDEFNIVGLYTRHDCLRSRAILDDGTEILTHDLWFTR